MIKEEVLYHWEKFCSLCRQLESTKHYVDHQVKDEVLLNGKVYSFEFQQIILMSAIEFESVGKAICLHIDPNFDVKNCDIRTITETILSAYSKITKTIVQTDVQPLQPLKDWRIVNNTETNTKYVGGLSWWNDYNNIKHQDYHKFRLANLKNAIHALGSLMILELYLMKIELGSIELSSLKMCSYFHNPYSSALLCEEENSLPDFVNKSGSNSGIVKRMYWKY